VVMLFTGWRSYRLSYSIYFASLLAASLSGSLESFSRYVLVMFPVFVCLGRLGERPLLDRCITSVFLLGLGLYMTLFAGSFWIA